MAAEKVTPEAIAFIVRHSSGVICMPVVGERLDELEIPLMVADNTDQRHTAFTVSVDARRGVTTGISAADRASTIRAIVDPDTAPQDLSRPAHLSAALSRGRGAQARRSHRGVRRPRPARRPLPGRGPVRDGQRGRHDGAAAGPRALRRRARTEDHLDRRSHRLSPRATRSLVSKVAEATIPTPHGEFRSYAYESAVDGRTHVALVLGDIGDGRGRPHPRALGVPDRGRLRVAAVRLRRAAAAIAGDHRRRRAAASSCTSAATRAGRSD